MATFFSSSYATSLAAWAGGIFLPDWLNNNLNNLSNGAISAVFSSTGLYDKNGVLYLSGGYGYPASVEGLPAGALWNNLGVVSVVPGAVSSGATVAYYGQISASTLLATGGANLPASRPTAGSLRLWNNNGVVSVA